MPENLEQRILRQYDESLDLYRGLTDKVESLIREMLQDKGIRVHSVGSRVKERNSLRDKIRRPDKNYSELSDLTNIAVIRIITYFEDDVDDVAECLEREFAIDWRNSVDRRATLDPDRFGYLSLHYVADLGPHRTRFFEYGRFKGLKFEIQTRSILQHAWAEMQHDLGYKSSEGVPRDARRRFSSLAGLLEIADHEFQRLRDELEKYVQDVPQRIESNPQDVEINKDSLAAFLRDNQVVGELDQELAAMFSLPIETHDDDSFLEVDVAKLRVLGIATIQELETKLRQRTQEIVPFVREFAQKDVDFPRGSFISPGVSVFYLAYLLAAATWDAEVVKRIIGAGHVVPLKNVDQFADRIREAYESISEHDS